MGGKAGGGRGGHDIRPVVERAGGQPRLVYLRRVGARQEVVGAEGDGQRGGRGRAVGVGDLVGEDVGAADHAGGAGVAVGAVLVDGQAAVGPGDGGPAG